MVQFILDNFDTIFRDEKSFQTFDKMILDLAVRGKLVPQIEDEEPASELLQRIKEEKEKPYDIPSSWNWVKLGKVSDILSGKGFESSNFSNKNGVPAIKITNIGVGKFIETSDYLPINYLEKYSEYIVVKNDILIALTRPYIKDGLKICTYQSKFKKALLNQRVALIRTSTLLNSEYIFIFMRTDYILEKFKYKFERQGLQPNLKNKDIIDLCIPLPPLKEQERIVEKVEKLQELSKRFKEIYNSNEKTRANLKKSILEEVEKSDTNNELLISLEKLFGNFEKVIKTKEDVKDIRNLVLSLAVRGKLVPQIEDEEPASKLLQRIKEEKERLVAEKVIKKEKPLPPITEDEKPFDIPDSWEWVRLKDIGQINPRNKAEDDLETGFIPMKLINDGLSNLHSFEVRKWKEIKNGFTHFANGDIVLAKITPCFENRKSVIIKNLINEIGAGTTELYVYRAYKNLIIPEFILNIFKTEKFITEGVGTYTGTAGQQRVKKDFFENYLISLPPIKEQERIVKRVDELMAVCDTLESKIETSEKINQKLLASLLK